MLKRVHAHENSKCNHNCDEVSKVIRSVLLLHIRANLGRMLARYYALCHADRSTLVMPVANNVQKDDPQNSGFKSYRPLVVRFETHGSRTASATKSQGAHACCSSDVFSRSTTVYL